MTCKYFYKLTSLPGLLSKVKSQRKCHVFTKRSKLFLNIFWYFESISDILRRPHKFGPSSTYDLTLLFKYLFKLPTTGRNNCTSNWFCNNLTQTRRKSNDNDNRSSHFGLIEEIMC